MFWDIALGALRAIPYVGKMIDAVTGYFHDRSVKNAQQTSDQRDTAVAGLKELDAASTARSTAAAGLNADSVRQPDPDTIPRGRDGIS